MAETPVVNEFEVEALIESADIANASLFAIIDGTMVALGSLNEYGRIDIRSQLIEQRALAAEEVRQVVARRAGRKATVVPIEAAHVKLIDTMLEQLKPEVSALLTHPQHEQGGPEEVHYPIP